MAAHAEIEEETYRRIAVWTREQETVTTGALQRAFRLSYNGALYFLQRLQREGVLGPVQPDGSMPVQK